MTHIERQADYWTRVAARTGCPEHVRAAEFWGRVANLKPGIFAEIAKPQIHWAKALIFAEIVQRITRWVTKG